MTYEVIVEWFVLQVEVTHCENIPPCFNAWNSDWDFYGSRELGFKVLSGNTYSDDGARMSVTDEELAVFAKEYAKPIEAALWLEIDASQRRSRWAA